MVRQGKVRDTYDLGEKLLIVTTDRQSAFDRILASVPFKGQVLNQTSAWWLEESRHIIPNAMLAVPLPNVMIMQKCSVFPVEIVVRAFLTAANLISALKAVHPLPCGRTINKGCLLIICRLETIIITPTTKSADGDIPISPEDIICQSLMTQEDWNMVSQAALKLFRFGQDQAAKRGLLLVDTKYEFGKSREGVIMLVDEMHTPDSSRYWIADSYVERHSKGEEPQSVDKEFLRLWFQRHCDPYSDKVLPPAPKELVKELSRRYIALYEMITGHSFIPDTHEDFTNSVIEKVKAALRNV